MERASGAGGGGHELPEGLPAAATTAGVAMRDWIEGAYADEQTDATLRFDFAAAMPAKPAWTLMLKKLKYRDKIQTKPTSCNANGESD